MFLLMQRIFFIHKKNLKWRISYEKLKKYFKNECEKNLGKIFVYTAYDSNRPQQKKFLDMLKINGYIVRTKEVKRRKKNDKIVVVMSTKHHISRELIQLSDKYINLKKLRDKRELKK
ncbi:MAG: hypothetical protein QMC93_02725 [Patescibacteria group bacterium]|nr:hypothetical protein [Patescibacteria group bacterium]